MSKLITFFTPTYNRADILHRCYESLQKQSCFDFDWIIIDDGSTDNTSEVVREWVKNETRFKISYIKKKNEGMYSGYNKALEVADTPLIVCLESDDMFAPDTMDIVKRNWEKIKDTDLIGFMTPCIYEDGSWVGDPFPEDVKQMHHYERFLKYHLEGDKTYVHKTEILKREAPMPVFEGEKCLNPIYLMYECDKYGYMAVSNEAFCITEYRPGGMTDTVYWQYYNSPNSFAEWRKQHMQFPNAPKRYIFKENIHYVSSCFLAHKLGRSVKESPKKGYTVLAFVPGLMMACLVLYKNKGKSKR